MRRVHWVLVFVCLLLCGCGGDGSPTSPTPGPRTRTFLSFVSEPGDYIGQGETRMYFLEDGKWNARVDLGVAEPNHVVVSVFPHNFAEGWWWTLNFSAPQGHSLKPGAYEDARRWPFAGAQPGLDFSGTGRGCNTLTGRFVIRELVVGPGNTLDRFHATFEQHCEGASPALRGEVRVLTDPWR